MKMTVLNGFRENDTYACKIYESIEDAAEGKCDIEKVDLSGMDIKPCMGCFGCWIKKPGRCLIEDDSEEVIGKLINSDVVVYLTPVVFGGYSSILKKLLDRSICLILPYFTKINGEMHHKKRYDKYPGIIGIGFMDNRSDLEIENFKNLVYRNSLNLHAGFQCADVVIKDDTEDEIKSKVAACRQYGGGLKWNHAVYYSWLAALEGRRAHQIPSVSI